jgi:hypothetical protein
MQISDVLLQTALNKWGKPGDDVDANINWHQMFHIYALRYYETLTQTNTCRIGVQLRAERPAQYMYNGRYCCPYLTETEGANKFC